jgi:predicted ABC-type ATPase
VNADTMAHSLTLEPYAAAKVAGALRREFLKRNESFVFETVFSDTVGDKLGFLRAASAAGYTVIVCYIGLGSSRLSAERVAMRVSQGGHDVPPEKLKARFPRSLRNLKAAIRQLPHVLIFDNSDLRRPFRRIAMFDDGKCAFLSKRTPKWLRGILD